MKVYFINPPFKAEYGKFSRENRSPAITRSGALYYPLWLLYAAGVCEKDGFDVLFLDAPAKPLDVNDSLEIVEKNGENTKLFVINTSTPSIYSDIEFSKKCKDIFPDAKVILVGTHPSALPEETIAIDKCIDAVARHEFDYVVRDYARAIRDNSGFKDVKGITYLNNGEIISNPDMPYIEDLDDIPFAAELIKKYLTVEEYFFAPAAFPEVQMFSGRGCMARCNFCVYPQTMHGHKYRLRSPQNVVDEFEYIAKNLPQVKEVVFEDDTFTIKKDRVIEICDLLIERGLNKRFRWLCNARVNLDLETMKKMKQAGCHLIIPGIESANQQILNNIKKGTTVNQVVEYVANAKKAGLLVHACYMVGNNGETPQTMQETLNLALKLNTDTAQFYPLLPFPGTEAYFWAKENGYIKGGYEDYVKEDGTINSLLELPNITSEEMVKFCDDARKKYYLRPRYIMHRIWVGLRDPEDLKRSLKAFGKIKKFLFK
ncbi:MAG: radical SAM protein [Lachnospiraceae bacterium]|nr:radical SAM protein [Lachnospiraceae bacterium]